MAEKAHYLIDDSTGAIVNTIVLETESKDPKFGWQPPDGHSVILVEDVKALDVTVDPVDGNAVERKIKAKDKSKAHKFVDRDYETLKAEADKNPKG